jgi:hypothetical protein
VEGSRGCGNEPSGSIKCWVTSQLAASLSSSQRPRLMELVM